MSAAALLNRLSVQQGVALVSVPTGYYGDAPDLYVVCGCGWCSLPHVTRPTKIVCEACETLAEGRRVYSKFFAPAIGKYGFQVEQTLQRPKG